MRNYMILVPAVALVAGLAACSGGGDGGTVHADKPVAKQSQQHKPHKPKQRHSAPAPKPSPTTLKVPTDLVGKTLGDAKERLTKRGFTHLVIAGGEVTDADPVASVPKAGESLAADAKLVVVGDPPEPVVDEPASSNEGTTANKSDPAGDAYREGMPPQPDEQPNDTPPKYGYQCGPGDAERYDVCAGHKAWVEGQREFTECKGSGGTWEIPSQSCVHKND